MLKTVHILSKQQIVINMLEGHELCVYQYLNSSQQSWTTEAVEQWGATNEDYKTSKGKELLVFST